MTQEKDALTQAAELAGFEAEVGGGGATTLFLQVPDGKVIAFGFVDGPLAYNVFTDSEQSQCVEGVDGCGEMDSEDATHLEMAEFIKKVAAKWDAYQEVA